MFTRVAIFLFAAFLTGCAVKPQMPVSLDKSTLGPATGKVGVAMATLPKVDTSLPGAGCLLCIAVATAANSTLIDYSRTLSKEDMLPLKEDMAKALREKGVDAVVIADEINMQSLEKNASEGENLARKDFSSLRTKYRIDKLMLVEVDFIGLERQYSSYIPSSPPKAVVRGKGYMVDLKSNAYLWYLPLNEIRGTDAEWDEPPKFPGLTNAYYQAIESGKDRIMDGLRK
ncbi:hypothetical protein SAMN04489710_10734 [Paracidovorax konjaci]|uniref:Lipoprotein n=2 Tax=Paracidovorax konjaci TaxID=32040 RepID=A0A1I1VRK0_9BURK|nr:hypothetical protein SAMN04489710_10734 [Paracidovorax konjaci]